MVIGVVGSHNLNEQCFVMIGDVVFLSRPLK